LRWTLPSTLLLRPSTDDEVILRFSIRFRLRLQRHAAQWFFADSWSSVRCAQFETAPTIASPYKRGDRLRVKIPPGVHPVSMNVGHAGFLADSHGKRPASRVLSKREASASPACIICSTRRSFGRDFRRDESRRTHRDEIRAFESETASVAHRHGSVVLAVGGGKNS